MSAAKMELALLVADTNMQFAFRGILGRTAALSVRQISYEIFVHPERDPGCRVRGADFLRAQVGRYDHALVVFDRHGCGQDTEARIDLERSVDAQLAVSWGDRARTIVLDPELEIWVWSSSPHVEKTLGWEGRDLRAKLREEGFFADGAAKPADPKAAIDWALERVRKPRSSKLYETIMASVSLSGCRDAAFAKLRETLAAWFPSEL